MADVADGPVHMHNMCARGGTPALTPGGVHTIRASENAAFLSLFPFLTLFLCPTLVRRGKIAQLLLQ